jgi:hypothetical protein
MLREYMLREYTTGRGTNPHVCRTESELLEDGVNADNAGGADTLRPLFKQCFKSRLAFDPRPPTPPPPTPLLMMSEPQASGRCATEDCKCASGGGDGLAVSDVELGVELAAEAGSAVAEGVRTPGVKPSVERAVEVDGAGFTGAGAVERVAARRRYRCSSRTTV